MSRLPRPRRWRHAALTAVAVLSTGLLTGTPAVASPADSPTDSPADSPRLEHPYSHTGTIDGADFRVEVPPQ